MKFEDADNLPYFEFSETLTQAIASKTQSTNYELFRLLVAYNLTKVASLMGAKLKTPHTGILPINTYVINLAPSGENKGFSMNIMESQIMHKFKAKYLSDVVPTITQKHIEALSFSRSGEDDEAYDKEYRKILNELKDCGEFAYSFDSGTTAGIKQFRHRLLLTDVGAINLEMDEIGSNLIPNADLMKVFLELYDIGKVKQKLIKNTAENVRAQELEGCTATNALLFGTPARLLDTGRTEEEFMAFLEEGYARRCFYSFTSKAMTSVNLSVDDLYDRLTNMQYHDTLESMADHFEMFANPKYHGKVLTIPEDVLKEWIAYSLACASESDKLSEFDHIRKAEIKHRHFKALKLAAAYSFLTKNSKVTMEALHGAIRVAQDSGKAFAKMLARDKPYVMLAKYLAATEREVTPTDLMEELPFYKGSAAARNEMFVLASSWGYKNGIVLSKNYVDGIEFLKAAALPKTNMDEIIFSHSNDMASNYIPRRKPFDKLGTMLQTPHHNFANHHFKDRHRSDDNTIAGVNMLIIDIDEGMEVQEALQVFKNHNYYIYTTKRHTDTDHRFRILLPLSHELSLSKEEYAEFVGNFLEYYPIPVADDASYQRSKKWLTHDGDIYSNFSGENVDALLFIPRSTKSDAVKQGLKDLKDMDSLERWFLMNTGNGNRNNQLSKYAFFLKDCGKPIHEVQAAVINMNSKLKDSMSDKELASTIFYSLAKRYSDDG